VWQLISAARGALWLPAVLSAILIYRQGANMKDWGFWDWISYSSLFIAAVGVAIQTNELEKLHISWLSKLNFRFLPAILVVAATVILSIKAFMPNTQSEYTKNAISLMKTTDTDTELRIRVDENLGAAPVEISHKNVFAWYAVWSPVILMQEKDKKGNITGHFQTPRMWTIFVIFDRPISYRQIILGSENQKIPPYEIKTSSPVYAAIIVNGDLPPGTLTIRAIF
jgi:hypothetical protein